MKNDKKALKDRWPTLGISKYNQYTGGSFDKWVRPKATADPRTEEARESARARLEEWGAWRIMEKGREAVVCMGRAERQVKKEARKNGKRAPAQRLMRRVIQTGMLPTAVGAGGDIYYLIKQQRHMVPSEMCDAFGVAKDSKLRKALVATRGNGRGKATERQAMMCMGAAIHVPSLKMVLADGMERAGVTSGKGSVNLYDVCSGVGTVAEAMEQLVGDRLRYVAAAENGKAQRQILKAAWAHRGLTEARMYKEAYGEEAETGPTERVDVYVMTPECGRWSRCQNNIEMEKAMKETDKVAQLMKYAREARPAVVVLESVADLLGSERVRACGERLEEIMRTHLPDYEWRAQVVDAHAHGDEPMKRERAFWVGTRPLASNHV